MLNKINKLGRRRCSGGEEVWVMRTAGMEVQRQKGHVSLVE